jgi:BlaR1 peptidase M56
VIFAARLALVLLAAFGLAALMLSAVLALAWHSGLGRARLTSGDLLAARLFPVGGGLIVVLTGVLPAFLLYEPAHEPEAIGPLVIALALLALATLMHGVARGGRAYLAARRILRDVGSPEPASAFAVVDAAEPIVAVVGGWRPRIIAARSVLTACEPDEWRQVLAHEAAHVVALDNLKFLLLLASPDALAWTPLAASLKARWRAATEFEADERAAGGDPRKRVALASALLKVARLSSRGPGPRAELSISVASADVEERVRRLLRHEQSDTPRRLRVREALGACALLVPPIAVPLYPRIQDLTELLVRLGS